MLANPLTPEETATLHTELQGAAYANLTDAQRLDLLNIPSMVANPVAQPQIPRTMEESDLAGLLTDQANGSLKQLLNWVNFGLLKADIDNQNHAGVGIWAMKCEMLGLITTAEAVAVQAYAAETIPDPSWPAQVPGPTPKARLFGADKTWTQADDGAENPEVPGTRYGTVVDFIPLAAVAAAR